MKKIIYAFIGKARSGKDTSAEILKNILEEEGVKPVHLAFADLLKEQAKMLGWNGDKDEKGRTFLQTLGDVVKEYHGMNYYSEQLKHRIEDSQSHVFLVTDLRFQAEFKMLDSLPTDEYRVIFVKVIRNRVEMLDGLTAAQRSHISEAGIDRIMNECTHSVTIHNDGTLDELKEKVSVLVPSDIEQYRDGERGETLIKWDPRNNRPRILFDMDDVINDFLGTLIEDYNKANSASVERSDITDWDLTKCKCLNAAEAMKLFKKKGFFLSIPPKASSVVAINTMIESTKYDIYIVTACGSVEEYKEKQEWLKKYIPAFNLNRLIMCSEKNIIRGDVLVDDKPQNLIECSPYMRCMLYDMPTNKSCKGFKRVSSLMEVLAILERMFY